MSNTQQQALRSTFEVNLCLRTLEFTLLELNPILPAKDWLYQLDAITLIPSFLLGISARCMVI
ncbi:hypothetical protein EMIT0P294_50321 [Pseudomonas sp. IT-P294]